jgi:hypothetical protein
VVDLIVDVLKLEKATPFCSSFLSIATYTSTATTVSALPQATVTVTTSGTSTTSTTSTATVSTTVTVTTSAAYTFGNIPPAVPLYGTGLPPGDKAKREIEARSIVIPAALKQYASAQLSTACSCLSLATPSTTATVTSTSTPAPIQVTVTTVVTTASDVVPTTTTLTYTTTSTSYTATTTATPTQCSNPYGYAYSYDVFGRSDAGNAVDGGTSYFDVTFEQCCLKCALANNCAYFQYDGPPYETNESVEDATCMVWSVTAGTYGTNPQCPKGIYDSHFEYATPPYAYEGSTVYGGVFPGPCQVTDYIYFTTPK